jgi:hypothetical protein
MKGEHPPAVRDAILKRIDAGETPYAIWRDTGIKADTIKAWAAKRIRETPPPAHPQVIPPPSLPDTRPPGTPDRAGRILIYDIETLPNQGWFFSLYTDKRSIPLAFVEKAKSVCTIAYKWLGDVDAHVISIADFPFADPYDDKWVIKTFLPVLEQAHYTVAHFGSGFDEPFLAARCMVNGLPPFPPVCNIDTYRLAKSRFKDSLNSNKLDHLGTLLEVGNKNHTDASLWVRCAKGDRDAIAEMAAYNKQDVALLEQVFVKMLPYVKSKINLNLLLDDAVFRCRSCGSSNLELKGFELTAATLRHRYRCLDCDTWSTKPRSKT